MVFETARLLQARGDDPVMLHFGSDYVSRFCKEMGIESQIIPNRKYYKKMVLIPFFWLATVAFLRRQRLDCLHSHLFGPIFAFSMPAWLAGLKHVGTLHDVYMIEEAPYRIKLIKLAKLLNTRLVAVSKPMQDFYCRRAGFKADAITYIPNFSPVNSELQHRQSVRDELGLSADTVAVFSVGRLVSLKRFDILVDAMQQCDGNKVKAFIVGDGPEKAQLENMIKQYGLSDTVHLLGERDDVSRLLAAADIFTLTSETEGMSKSILEALASRLPVIATDVGGNCDLVLQGDNGYLLPDHQPDRLSAKINELANNNEMRHKMGERSLELLSSEYSEALFLERHINIYQ